MTVTRTYTPQQILALPMGDNDAGATTIGQYLIRLSQQCWLEEDGFSGKRPFGNSGWSHDIDKALIRANAVHGRLDGDGYIDDIDSQAAVDIIKEAYSLLLNADFASLKQWEPPRDWYVVLLEINPYNGLTLEDYITDGMTEKEAKRMAEESNKDDGGTRWMAVHITK